MRPKAASHIPTYHQIFGLAWSPDGQQLATVCKDGHVRVYEPRSGPEPLQVSTHRPGMGPQTHLGGLWLDLKCCISTGRSRT
jgi:coronin-7